MHEPRTADLPPALAEGARAIARRLREAGHRAWIVGGAVRDLALGRAVHDVDLVSAARPEEVQALFPRTVPVGAAFGIVVVVHAGLEVEVATFREERGYGDARRPDEVRYSTDPRVDAERRDFTCNALYLDPLGDELFDPLGGLADLARRRLATVGDAGQRFREDGLRLLRMARFEAALDLAPAEGLHAAAAAALPALVGVSPERVLDELAKVFAGPRAGRAVRVLDTCGIASAVVPGHAELAPDERRARLAVLDGHGALTGPFRAPGHGPDGGVVLGLAGLLGRALPAPAGTDLADDLRHQRASLERLRASRATLAGVAEVERLSAVMGALARTDTRASARLRALRSPWFAAGFDLAWRRAGVRGESTEALTKLAAWCAQGHDPAPRPFIGAADLAALGIAPGPRFGALLVEAEDAQLDGLVRDRAGALRWLAERAVRP